MPESLTYTVGGSRTGATIAMDIIELQDFQENSITDELHGHILTEVYARWLVTINPASCSYKYAGTPNAAGGADGTVTQHFGEMPAGTEQAIVFHLSQPRGRVRWTIGDAIQLECPFPGKTVDSNNGPVPEVVSIQKIHGTRTYSVVWAIRCYISRANKFNSQPPLLLSNVWSMTETLNDQYLSVRYYEGRAKFATDRMPSDAGPDTYRSFLLPVPLRGFKRQVSVTITADGSQCIWSATDTEQRVRLETQDICRVTVQHSADLIVPSVMNQITAITGAVAGAAGAMGAGITAFGDETASRASRLGGLAGGAGKAALAFTQQVSAALPCITYTVNVRVWGSKGANMFLIQQHALQVANYHLRRADIANANSIYSRSGLHILHDPGEGVVEVSLSIQTPTTADANTTLPTFMAGNPDGFVPSDYFPPVNTPQAPPPSAKGASIPPRGEQPGGQTCRGWFTGQIFSQALQGMAQPPEAPALPTLPPPKTTPNRS